MEILAPFLRAFERHNGMLIAPVDKTRPEPVREDAFRDAFVAADAPPLTLVANR